MRPRFALFLTILSLASCELFPTATGSCQGPLAVVAPDTVYAEAFHDDCGGPGDLDGDVYQFTLIAQTDLLFRMTPDGFRGGMGLYRGVYGEPSPKLIFETYGPGSAPFGARAYLPVGQYFLMAGPSGRSGGDYDLAFTPASASNCAVFDWTDFGADLNGSVSSSDCGAAENQFQDIYGLWLNGGEQVQVTVIANTSDIEVEFRRQGDGNVPPIASHEVAAFDSVTFTAFAATKSAYGIHVVAPAGVAGPYPYRVRVRTP
jgi:hypothetical protein